MTMHQARLAELVRRDPRFAYEAYEFLYEAFAHTERLLGGMERHVTGPELLEGIRDLALREYGLLARTVFKLWGINRTEDFGEMIFNLVTMDLVNKTERDERGDFAGVFDLDEALVRQFRIELGEAD